MSIMLRGLLVVGAIITTSYFGNEVKKGKLDIKYSLFWILFSLFLVFVSLFPFVLIKVSSVLSFKSPANFLFLLIIFVIFMREFVLTVQLSKLEEKNKKLIQKIALERVENE